MVVSTHSVVEGLPVRARHPFSPFRLLRRTETQATHDHRDSAASAPTTSRADRIEKVWILSVVGYTVLRFVIAWGAFGDHGANIWIFGFIDIATAVPYAKAVAIVCRRAADFEWRRLPVPIGLALASFFAPYAYLWFAAGSMPGGVRLGLAICVTVLAIAATSGVVIKVRKLRSPELTDVTTAAVAEAQRAEVHERVIDLTGKGPQVFNRPRVAS